jgi:hypothetical protein
MVSLFDLYIDPEGSFCHGGVLTHITSLERGVLYTIELHVHFCIIERYQSKLKYFNFIIIRKNDLKSFKNQLNFHFEPL